MRLDDFENFAPGAIQDDLPVCFSYTMIDRRVDEFLTSRGFHKLDVPELRCLRNPRARELMPATRNYQVKDADPQR